MTKVDIIIIATVILSFALILLQISSHLREIHLVLCRIYEVLESETGPYKQQVIEQQVIETLKANPTKKHDEDDTKSGKEFWVVNA